MEMVQSVLSGDGWRILFSDLTQLEIDLTQLEVDPSQLEVDLTQLEVI